MIAIGIFQTYYETGPLSSYSPSTIAWIPSLEVFMMFSGGPIWGKVYDNYGPRYLLLAGTFFNVFGLMMVSIRFVVSMIPGFYKLRRIQHGVLAFLACAGNMQPSWGEHDLLSSHVLRDFMVL